MERNRLDFSKFQSAISAQFGKMVAEGQLFRVSADKDRMWETYLESFPVGTNNVLRERREYDCSCCKSFVRAMGNVVSIIDDKIVSLWDAVIPEPAYQAVADALSAHVKSHAIEDQFLHPEQIAGTERNREILDTGEVVVWNHFFVQIPHARNQGRNYTCKGVDIATKLGEARSRHDVFLRALKELSLESVDTALELIGQNSLYRGNEHKNTISSFRAAKIKFDKMKDDTARDIFAWSKAETVGGAVAHIRNSSIGTLLVDLSEGMDLEAAVSRYERVVAPQNYRRPTSLVTKSMVDNAKKEIERLGLTSALERRYATLADIRVPDILFADRAARKVMKDPFDGVATKKASVGDLSKVESLPIEKFISDVLPKVDSVEVLFENKHAGNLVSLVAPVDSNAAPLFKWGNGFSWSYAGDVADSIKERVKTAGGNVSGDLCCRLAWFNHDDLDLHMREPGFEISFRSKLSPYTGGQLDVDMNAGGGQTRSPVENIFYGVRARMKEGRYQLLVHNFHKRETENVGFEIEIDWLGDVRRFAYEKAVRNDENIVVATFDYSHREGVRYVSAMDSTPVSRKLWGVDTGDFRKANLLMRSPNHWDGERGIGSRHYFFMLDGCVNEGQARGFYNEFLNEELSKHRKVLEIVGGKMKTDNSAEQLSGVGFSDSRPAEIVVRVKGNFTRTLKVTI